MQVKGVTVTPRDVVAAVLPDPAKIGHLMHGEANGCEGARGRAVGACTVCEVRLACVDSLSVPL